jgi:hypothetical protein
MAKLICPDHGYYDASEINCPLCQNPQSRPPEPAPLGFSGDDLETQIGGSQGMMGGNYGDDPTELGRNYQEKDDNILDQTDIGQLHQFEETEIELMDEGPLGILWVMEGPRRGQVHRIKDETVVGRTRGDIILDDPKVSSNHAKFTYEDEKFFVWDFGTRNGTYVNGEKIRAATPLEENDKIKIGDYQFVLKILQ